MTYPKILILDANHPKALAVARALKGMEVYTAASSKHTMVSCSRFSKAHFVCDIDKAECFVEQTIEICKRNDIKIIITPEERSSLLVARNHEQFAEAGIVITTPPLASLKIAMDKSLTITAARECDVPVPETVDPKSIADAKEQADRLGYPVAIKPRFSYFWNGQAFILGKGTSYANNAQQIEAAILNRPAGSPMPLLQKYVRGYGAGIFLALNKNHDVVAQFAHERVRDFNPTGSGSVLRKSIPVDPVLLEHSVRLLKHIGWHGVAMVEYRIDPPSNKIYLMEINGRFWGSLQLATDSGVNFPKAVVDIALNNPVKINTYKYNVLSRWWLGDLMRLLLVFCGKPEGYSGDFPTRRKALWDFLGPQPCGTCSEVFRWNDPLPAFFEFGAFVSKYSKKIFKRFI